MIVRIFALNSLLMNPRQLCNVQSLQFQVGWTSSTTYVCACNSGYTHLTWEAYKGAFKFNTWDNLFALDDAERSALQTAK